MQGAKQSVLESEINGCQVTLHFTPQSVDGVIENVQSILSKAYDERVQSELSSAVRGGVLASGNICG